MWSLANKADTVYYLPSGGSYTIGRKNTDIIILEDQSISRLHALITVKDDNVVLKDEKSKFGTEVNGCKLSSEQVLSNGDIIKFGQGTTSFKLKKQDLVFCYSNMTSDVKEQVSAIVDKLGSKIVSNWSSSCTHLVMKAVTITAKVVNALSTCCPIVSVAWLEESLKCLNQKKVLPSSDNYIPEVVDPNLLQLQHADVSLKPMLMRRRLFLEKHIYFLNKKQYLMLQYCLKAAGGKPHLITDVNDERIKLLADDNALVIDPLVNGPLISKVKNTLKLSNSRLISESEIGYGILHCSISHYCNAKSLEGCSQIPPQLPPSLSIPYTQPSVGNDTILALNSEVLNSQTSTTREVQGRTMEGSVLEIDETILRDQTPSNATLMSHSAQLLARKVARSSNETILAPDSLTVTQNISSQKRQRLDSDECSFSKKTKLSQSESENFLATPHSIPNVPMTSTFLSSRHASPQKISLPDFEVSDTVASPRTQSKKNVERADSSMFAGLLTQRRKVECATSEDTKPPSNQQDTHSEQEMEHTEALEILQSSMNIHVSCDGFISARQPHTLVSKREEIPEEERLPTEVVVETVGLVRKFIPSNTSVDISCIRNFKTFKKVTHPRNHSSVSRLIGGADLFSSSLQRAL